MERVQLQIGITLDEQAVTTLIGLIAQAVERGTARQTEKLEKVAEGLKKLEHSSPATSPAATMAPTSPDAKPPAPEKPELIDTKEVARMLGLSPRTVWRFNDAGRLPKPVKLGTLVRWPRKQIEAWLAAGCPSRRTR
ncbi:MAG TPA: hypothetical protein DD670_13840 [Planctomycetaceae bacterium]|nr:hypothetical protein [Planctomycetaceae bacterium]